MALGDFLGNQCTHTHTHCRYEPRNQLRWQGMADTEDTIY